MISALDRDDILGDMFYTGGLEFYAQLIGLNRVSELQNKAHQLLLAGYGTYGYEPSVAYLYGIPSNIHQGWDCNGYSRCFFKCG